MAPDFASATYRKVTWRLIPLLFGCYILAYLDRVNVGFAKLAMKSEPWFSEAVFAAGAGIFFLGYFFFEVPGNILLHRLGARLWIARIMIGWGVMSALMACSSSAVSFYTLRFLLGVAEAGFFPGIILYLIGLSAATASVAFAACAIPGLPALLVLALLAVAITGVMSALACFWALPTAMLSGTAAAAGIAWINSVGNLAGYLSPEMVGWLKRHHGLGSALLGVAVMLALASALVLFGVRTSEGRAVRKT